MVKYVSLWFLLTATESSHKIEQWSKPRCTLTQPLTKIPFNSKRKGNKVPLGLALTETETNKLTMFLETEAAFPCHDWLIKMAWII